MSKKSVLYVTGNHVLNGAPHHLMLPIWLGSRGYDIFCICPSEHENEKFLGIENIKFINSGNKLSGISIIFWYIKNLYFFILSIFQCKPCSIIFYGPQVSYLFPIAQILKIAKIDTFYQTQDYLDPNKYKIRSFMEGFLARSVKYCIANDINRALFLKTFYNLSDIPFVIKTALPRFWKITKKEPPEKNYVEEIFKERVRNQITVLLHQGKPSNKRCSNDVIKALTELPERFVLIFSGISTDEGLKFLADQNLQFLSNRIGFTGTLRFDELMVLNSQCDIGLLLYPNDDLGNFYQCPGRLTENLKCGLSFVSSDSPNFELFALRHNISTICDATDAASISKALLLQEKRLRQDGDALRVRCRELADRILAYDLDAEALISVLNSK